MKVSDFTYLLQHPSKVVDPIQTKQLEDVLEEFPYFQSARALHLKGLKNLNSYKYNNALKVTAAHTTDRDVLFDFITSKNFLAPESPKEESQLIKNVLVSDALSESKKPLIEASKDKPLPQDQKDADKILDPKLFKHKEPITQEEVLLDVGKPLAFDKKEKYSFTEWLQLASNKPIPRIKEENNSSSNRNQKGNLQDKASLQKQKFDRIDKLIAQNPKIVPKENTMSPIDVSGSAKLDKNELMTETLARVYLEQKKYKKAIQAYKILSLKYPEKSGFFADRIKTVEKIQQENKREK